MLMASTKPEKSESGVYTKRVFVKKSSSRPDIQ